MTLSGPIRELSVVLLKTFTDFNSVVSAYTSKELRNIGDYKNNVEQQASLIERQNKEIEELKFERNYLSSVVTSLNSTNSLLMLNKTRFPKAIAAKIISRSPSSWHSELIINVGTKQNIKAGMVAVTQKGILGQVQDVKPNYSIIQLIAGSQVKFGAMSQRSKVLGVLYGEKPGYAQLRFVPIGSDIQKGDIIQTSEINTVGISRYYPFAYPVGQVIEVSNNSNNSELFIRLKLFEDASTTTNVLVLLPGGDPFIPLPAEPKAENIPAPAKTVKQTYIRKKQIQTYRNNASEETKPASPEITPPQDPPSKAEEATTEQPKKKVRYTNKIKNFLNRL